MKVLFDTCVIVDILGKSDHWFDSYCAYDVALLRGFSPCLSVSSTTDVCYLLHSRGLATKHDALELTERTLDLFELIDNLGGRLQKGMRQRNERLRRRPHRRQRISFGSGPDRDERYERLSGFPCHRHVAPRVRSGVQAERHRLLHDLTRPSAKGVLDGSGREGDSTGTTGFVIVSHEASIFKASFR